MLNRRAFLKSMAVASAGLAVAPGQILGNEVSQNQKKTTKTKGEKVKIAFVGIGNRGEQVIEEFEKTGMIDVMALCDVDLDGPQCQKVLARYPNVKKVQRLP